MAVMNPCVDLQVSLPPPLQVPQKGLHQKEPRRIPAWLLMSLKSLIPLKPRIAAKGSHLLLMIPTLILRKWFLKQSQARWVFILTSPLLVNVLKCNQALLLIIWYIFEKINLNPIIHFTFTIFSLVVTKLHMPLSPWESCPRSVSYYILKGGKLEL